MLNEQQYEPNKEPVEFDWAPCEIIVDNIAVDMKSPTSSEYLVSYTTSEDNHTTTWFEEWPDLESATARADSLFPFTQEFPK